MPIFFPIYAEGTYDQVGTKELHVGRVVEDIEHNGYNGYDDSDFCAVVAMDDGSFQETRYASTSFAGGGHCVVDASPELMQAYRDYLAYESGKKAYYKMLDSQAEVAVGKRVVVARGRKVPKGTQGVVVWTGRNDYTIEIALVRVPGEAVNIRIPAKNLDVVLDENGMAVLG